MNYYQTLIDAELRQRDAARERKRRVQIAEATERKPRLRIRLQLPFRLELPPHQPSAQRQPPAPCPEATLPTSYSRLPMSRQP